MTERDVILAVFAIGAVAGYLLCYFIMSDDDSNVKPRGGDRKEGGRC